MDSVYEYKTITIESYDSIDDLNGYYVEGWVYVDSVAQIVSCGSSPYSKVGKVYFTLKRKCTT